jgi:MbtH protein
MIDCGGLVAHIPRDVTGDDLSNPFEDESDEFIVLANAEEQFSLWPAFRAPPAGWTVAWPGGTLQACVDWIEERLANAAHKAVR